MMYDSMKSRQDQAHCYLLHLSDVSGHSLSPAVRYLRGTCYCTAEYLWYLSSLAECHRLRIRPPSPYPGTLVLKWVQCSGCSSSSSRRVKNDVTLGVPSCLPSAESLKIETATL